MDGRMQAAALLLCALPAAAEGQPPRDSRLTVADRIAVRVEHFTGPVERHCGIYLLESRDASVAKRDVTTAVRCLAAAKRRGLPSWALWQTGYGIEGPSFAGVATSPVSDTHLVFAGVGVGLEVRLTPCLTPRVQKDATVACRNRSEPLTADDVEDALGDLTRDVSRTLDKGYAPLVDAARRRVAADAEVKNPGFLPAIIDDVQRALEDASGAQWPVCPIHHDHALEHRDRYWLCQRDGLFVAALGALPRRRQDRR